MKRVSVFYCIILLTSCSLTQQQKPIDPTEPIETPEKINEAQFTAEKLMINDLLSALNQVLEPINTTVQISSSVNTPLYQMVASAFALNGFGVQKVSTDQGPMLVSTDVDTQVPVSGQRTSRLRIGVGPLSISRSYAHESNDEVVPVSPFRLYGTRAPIDVTSTLFGSIQPDNAAITATEYVAPIGSDEPLPLISLITPELVQQVVAETTGAPAATSLNSSKVEINNLYFSDSTFASILDDYEQQESLTVVFPNDSIVMGDENKLLVRRFVERFDESKDVISLIGCSNGPTASDLGNVGLALGRAERVTVELVDLGVPREKILDEGCWAPEGNVKEFPGRGVVMELWRTAS